MSMSIKQYSLIVAAVWFLAAGSVSAHQPRIAEGENIRIANPEVSQAFYGELTGAPVRYQINSSEPFRLYVGLLVPDLPSIQKDISAEIFQLNGTKENLIAFLDGKNFEWTPFYEEFAGDNYFWGPEFAATDSKKGVELKGQTVPAGSYIIQVTSSNQQGKYSLVTGDLEEFPLKEMLSAAITVPRVKAQFFNASPFSIITSPFGWGYILVLYVLAFLFGLGYRFVLRKFVKAEPYRRPKNIGAADRIGRAVLGLALLGWAVSTAWNPWLIFFSGFCFFEAIFSWCGLYAALGKNSCPL